MRLKHHRHGSTAVIEVRGQMVGGPDNSTQFHELVRLLVEEGDRNFVLDLSRVSFLNSQGIGMILGAMTTIKREDGVLKIAAPNSRTRTVFHLIQLYRILGIYESLERALASYEDDSIEPDFWPDDENPRLQLDPPSAAAEAN